MRPLDYLVVIVFVCTLVLIAAALILRAVLGAMGAYT